MDDDLWLIHRHFAERGDERLDFVKSVPQSILLAGADGDVSRSLLAARYPKAVFSEYDHRPDFLREAAARRKEGLLARLSGKKPVAQHLQPADAPLPAACADMLWANLDLLSQDEILPVLRVWADALKTDGLLFFTHLGSETLPEIESRLKESGIRALKPALIDMHDLGDMLADNGFYDPVMDTAKLELHYRSAGAFWQDMETAGIWRAMGFDDEAAARAAVDGWWRQGVPVTKITLETVFGHAVKKQVLPEGEQPVRFLPRRGGRDV